jgi:hypothetical protein
MQTVTMSHELDRTDLSSFLGPVIGLAGATGAFDTDYLLALYMEGLCGAMPRLLVQQFRCRRTSIESEVAPAFGNAFANTDLFTFFAVEATAVGGSGLLFVFPAVWAVLVGAAVRWARRRSLSTYRWWGALLVMEAFKLESDWPLMDTIAVLIKVGIIFAAAWAAHQMLMVVRQARSRG